jgi:hypothetical protein
MARRSTELILEQAVTNKNTPPQLSIKKVEPRSMSRRINKLGKRGCRWIERGVKLRGRYWKRLNKKMH